MFRLDGKTVAVIGAGSGIGAAVAIGVARQGGHAICFDLNGDGAAATAATITSAGGSADAGVVDITDVTSVRDALANSLRHRSGLDGLVCTPAINVRKPILKYAAIGERQGLLLPEFSVIRLEGIAVSNMSP